jgi:pimeloyl-ACP methyl ester carboxylesterase
MDAPAPNERRGGRGLPAVVRPHAAPRREARERAREIMAGLRDLDIRELLPSIRVPTLILHRAEETWVRVDHSRYLAEDIRDAKYVELPGGDHWPWMGDSDAVIDEIEEFVTGARCSLHATPRRLPAVKSA